MENEHDELATYLSEVTSTPIPPKAPDEDEKRYAEMMQEQRAQEESDRRRQSRETSKASRAFAESGESQDADRVSDLRAGEIMQRVDAIMSRAKARQQADGTTSEADQIQLTAEEEEDDIPYDGEDPESAA